MATLNETDSNSANNTDAESTTVNNALGCTAVAASSLNACNQPGGLTSVSGSSVWVFAG